MKLSTQIERLIESLRQEGCSEEVLARAQELLVDAYAWERRLVAIARANLMLSDTLVADRTLFEVRLRFEKHYQKMSGSD